VSEFDYKRDGEAAREAEEILGDAATMAVLEEGLKELERGETVALVELRRELAAARPDFD
jgi:hypothetical protein